MFPGKAVCVRAGLPGPTLPSPASRAYRMALAMPLLRSAGRRPTARTTAAALATVKAMRVLLRRSMAAGALGVIAEALVLMGPRPGYVTVLRLPAGGRTVLDRLHRRVRYRLAAGMGSATGQIRVRIACQIAERVRLLLTAAGAIGVTAEALVLTELRTEFAIALRQPMAEPTVPDRVHRRVRWRLVAGTVLAMRARERRVRPVKMTAGCARIAAIRFVTGRKIVRPVTMIAGNVRRSAGTGNATARKIAQHVLTANALLGATEWGIVIWPRTRLHACARRIAL
jgi:hypothetical protein